MKKPLHTLLKLVVGAAFVSILYFGWTLLYAGDDKIKLLEPSTPYASVNEILQHGELKGKVVYADMWGTTCVPCLDEFKRHTEPLKRQYQNNKEIAFLYICLDKHPGAAYRWKKRIKEYNIEGYHVLLNEEQFVKFYGEVSDNPGATEYFMPRYFIANKQGKFVARFAKRPSDYKVLYNQIDSTLRLQ